MQIQKCLNKYDNCVQKKKHTALNLTTTSQSFTSRIRDNLYHESGLYLRVRDQALQLYKQYQKINSKRLTEFLLTYNDLNYRSSSLLQFIINALHTTHL